MKETHQGGINNLLKFSRPHWLGGEEEDEEGQRQRGGGGGGAGHLDPCGGGGRHREQCHLGSPAGRGHSRNINNKNLEKGIKGQKYFLAAVETF